MTNVSNTSYQPAVAYQGEQVNTSLQEPKSGQTQPLKAPAADTQRSGQENDKQSLPHDRGKELDITV
ncbi:MAG: hypothetical protein KAI76_07295 [Alphaproteobacteria bacterium]|nr:hypothetical protein [Alphaproteobacteria bacterium]